MVQPRATSRATIHKESGSWAFTIGSAVFQLIVAWLVTFVIYQIGSLAMYGGNMVPTIVICCVIGACAIAAIVVMIRRKINGKSCCGSCGYCDTRCNKTNKDK